MSLDADSFFADESAVGKLVRTFKKSYKRLDGLVNCAGTTFFALVAPVAGD